jgi:hypothetical protein
MREYGNVYFRLVLKSRGVKLRPKMKGTGVLAYMLCKECGQDFAVGNIEAYASHVRAEHPRYCRWTVA